MSIQRENNQIKQLEAENHELKKALVDYQFALDLIMFKYRKQISQLIKFNQITRQQCLKNGMACGGHPQQAAQEADLINSQSEKIRELVTVMQKSLQLEDESQAQIGQKMKQLSEENKMLRQMLQISESISGPTFGPNINKTTAEVAVQTDEGLNSDPTASLVELKQSVSSAVLPTSSSPSSHPMGADDVSDHLGSFQSGVSLSNPRELLFNASDADKCTPTKVSPVFLSSSSDHSPNDVNTRFADQVGTIKKNLPNGRVDSNLELDSNHVTI